MAHTLPLDIHSALAWVRQTEDQAALQETVEYEVRYTVVKAAERRIRVLRKASQKAEEAHDGS